ncbi:CHAT domain-containing protein [Candidatus Protochlamydia sp. W-9]|uniref:CHAT domain-containing protein n=1 Tax=Candidatus Protochlamydia sp. W-9 TaxID=1785087 RepID=UPI00096AC418|nr:CHAT domain-containing protein [Candidatus Protochlamydia sp. W-9]
MNVNSIQFNTLYDPLIFQSSQISLLDQVKDLTNTYDKSFLKRENIIICAKVVFEKIIQLKDISIKRECLCLLLKLEMEEIQNLIIPEIGCLFGVHTFLYSIQQDQAQQLIQLEEIVSKIIETKLKSNEYNFMMPICSIYRDILVHLWLLSHLEVGKHCADLLIQNKDAILSKMERWKDSLYQLAREEKIHCFMPKSIEKSVLRLFETLPEVILKDMEIQKTVIHKSGELPLAILEIMGNCYGKQGDFPNAISYTEILLNILSKQFPEMSKDKELFDKVRIFHGNIAVWYKSFKEYRSAIYHCKKALWIAKELNNPSHIFACLIFKGTIYLMQEEQVRAFFCYKKAETIARDITNPKMKRQAFISLAKVYLSLSSDTNEEAIQCYQAALCLAEEKTEQASIYNEIGDAQNNAQRYQEAEESYQKALEILAPDNFLEAIKIHRSLATLFDHLDRYGKAIYHAEKTLELILHPSVQIDEIQILESKLWALTILGKIYTSIEDPKKGLDYHIQASTIAEKLTTSSEYSRYSDSSYMNLGATYSYLGRNTESIDYYIKALEITEDRLNQAKLLINLGNSLYRCNKFVEAIKRYKKAIKISDKLEIKINSFNGLGLCYISLGKEMEAIQSIKKAICLSQDLKRRRNEAAGYYNLGQIYKNFDPKVAKEDYLKSVDAYAALYQELKNHLQWQITFFEEQVQPLLSLENLFLKQAKTKKALQVTDFRRSRALVSSLTKKFQFQKNSYLFSSALNSQDMQALAQKLHTCLVVYSLASESMDSITVWIIPSQGKITYQQLPLGILTEEFKAATQVFKTFPFIAETRTIGTPLESFLEELTRGGSDKNVHSSNSQAFKKHLKNWYEILITPIASYLPKDPQQVVTIIPDGFLSQIPFAAFLDNEGKYLIEKHPISIAPSIEILKLLNEIPKDFSENSLVIGNPATPHSKDSLPFAEKEAQTIVAPLLKTTPEKILLQDSATAQRVLEGMRDARWIHLACHGSTGAKPEEKLDPHSVFEGLFKLAPDEEHIQGYLHAQEIVPLTLRTELVFMSACFSGRGKLHREGSVGPVWSFLAAGALSTVATYWRLPDSDLTLQMVDTFYRHLLGIEVEKLNKAQALQKAMLVGIEQKRDKPHLWGAFFLSGLHE